MKSISLGKSGKFALVDDEDYERVTRNAWHISQEGYVVAGVGPRKAVKHVSIHRIILDAQPGEVVDHINHDKLDNRRDNLRITTNKHNCWNRKIPNTNKTGAKGVYVLRTKSKNKYRAMIQYNNKKVHLGVFSTIQAAKQAYIDASNKYYGEYSFYKDSEIRKEGI